MKRDRRRIYYKGFLILECYGKEFNDKYYTIINPETGSHVHCEHKNSAYKIIDNAIVFRETGAFLKSRTPFHIAVKATKLALRDGAIANRSKAKTVFG